MDKAQQIVNHMMKNDAFSQWLGMQVVSNKAGSAVLEMIVRN